MLKSLRPIHCQQHSPLTQTSSMIDSCSDTEPADENVLSRLKALEDKVCWPGVPGACCRKATNTAFLVEKTVIKAMEALQLATSAAGAVSTAASASSGLAKSAESIATSATPEATAKRAFEILSQAALASTSASTAASAASAAASAAQAAVLVATEALVASINTIRPASWKEEIVIARTEATAVEAKQQQNQQKQQELQGPPVPGQESAANSSSTRDSPAAISCRQGGEIQHRKIKQETKQKQKKKPKKQIITELLQEKAQMQMQLRQQQEEKENQQMRMALREQQVNDLSLQIQRLAESQAELQRKYGLNEKPQEKP